MNLRFVWNNLQVLIVYQIYQEGAVFFVNFSFKGAWLEAYLKVAVKSPVIYAFHVRAISPSALLLIIVLCNVQILIQVLDLLLDQVGVAIGIIH